MLEVTKDTFDQEVLQASGLVLVDYWNEGCEPCKALMPHMEELAKKYPEVKFCKLNTSLARRLAISQRILGLPTISLYRNGVKIDEVTKENATIKNIEDMIKKYI